MTDSLDRSRRAHPAVRASDVDRDRCTAILVENYSAGLLDYETLQSRLDRALGAVDQRELAALVADLQPGTSLDALPTSPNSVRRLSRGVGVAAAGVAAAMAVTVVLIQGGATGSHSAASSPGVCVATGVAVGENEKCPTPTRVQREIQESVDRAAAAAAQAAAAADGAVEGSRLDTLAQSAQTASERAIAALARAQTAAATAQRDADTVIAAAARQADQAADDAARAAIRADLEASA